MGQGFITLPAGIALAFGANIGTCVTAMLAAIGKPREALRAAVVHVLFNVFGVVIWLAFIDQLAQFVTWFSPVHEELSGTAKLAAETPRQIANAHTVFNIANTFIFIGFTTQFARLVEWLVPDKPIEEELITQPKYLDEDLLETPSLALDRVRLEIGNAGKRVLDMMQQILPALIDGDKEALKEIAKIDDVVDTLHGHIITYLGKLSRKTLTDKQSDEFVNLMAAANDLESIGDVIETDLVYLGMERIENGITISAATREVFENLHKEVSMSVAMALNAVMEKDEEAALGVLGMKDYIGLLVQSADRHQAQRLVADEPNRLEAYAMEIDVIEKLKRIYYFSKRIAKASLLEAATEKAAD